MLLHRFFYPVATVRHDGEPDRLCGCAFVVSPGANLVTCRHVVDLQDAQGRAVPLAVLDMENQVAHPVADALMSDDVDLAYLPNALNAPDKKEFIPIIDPEHVLPGTRAWAWGFYSVDGGFPVENGHFSGDVVTAQRADVPGAKVVVPFPFIEGMSGTALMTHRLGRKVLGVACGNRQQSVVAQEVHQTLLDGTSRTDTIHRLVEFGEAHHAAVLIQFLNEVAPASGFRVSSFRVPESHADDES